MQDRYDYYDEEEGKYYRKAETRSPTGGRPIPTKHYEDGSTEYNFGGPCGKAKYDKYGEEC
jgi:hypothetical protein